MPSEALPSRVEVAVVGAGPAGLSAGIHLARARISHLLCGVRLGGLLRSAGLVECYPGFPEGVAADELVARMLGQARTLGVRLQQREVLALGWSRPGFLLELDGGSVQAAAVILATGTVPRLLQPSLVRAGLDPERLVYETSDLPPVLSEAAPPVLISGGGDAAFDSALQLAGRGVRSRIVLRGARPTAMALLVERARAAGAELLCGHRIRAVAPGPAGASVLLEDPDGRQRNLETPCLLICHGRDPALALWHRLTSDRSREPRQVESLFPGLFLAGDLVRGSCRYVGVAVGDGLRCARLAEAHLERYRGASPQRTPGSP